jgi:hypothetical protein
MSFWLIDDQFFIIVGFWGMLIIFVAVFRIAVMEEPRPPFPLSVLLEAATRLGGRWLATPLPHAACAPASGNCQRIDPPSSGDHGVLKVGHEPPGRGHVAGGRPRSSGEVSGNDIEQSIFLNGFQSAVSRCVGIAGVEGSNQLGVFLDDDPQGEVRGGSHATPFKLPPAAGQRSGQ